MSESAVPLRWLLFATHVPASGAGGGMVRYVVSLGKALHDRSDVDLHVLTTPAAVPFFVETLGIPAARVHKTPSNVLMSSLAQRVGLLGTRQSRFDVIMGTKHLLPRHAKRSGTAYLLTLHDLLVFQRPRDYPLSKRVLLPRQYRASIRGADALLCVSRAVAAAVREFFPQLDAEVAAVPLGLSEALAQATPTSIAGLTPGGFALVVGDASPRKNLRFVAQLWPAVRSRIPDAVLVTIGPKGWGVDGGLEQLDALAEAGHAVRLTGLGDGELRWAYENAAVMLCPSRQEGFGLPALEARAFGLSIVSSPDPALAEAAGGSALVRSLDDPHGWVQAIVESWQLCRDDSRGVDRSWDDLAAETVAVARAVLAHKRDAV